MLLNKNYWILKIIKKDVNNWIIKRLLENNRKVNIKDIKINRIVIKMLVIQIKLKKSNKSNWLYR